MNGIAQSSAAVSSFRRRIVEMVSQEPCDAAAVKLVDEASPFLEDQLLVLLVAESMLLPREMKLSSHQICIDCVPAPV